MNKTATDIKKLTVLDTGPSDYKNCWNLQKELVQLRYKGKIPDTLILTEHNPVITMGRGTNRKNLLAGDNLLQSKGVELFEIERGGDITFHGPGQLVAYPIVDLTKRGRDTHRYLRDLEIVLINTLNKLDLDAGTKEGLTGVWVDSSKIAAIGVGVSKWITYHGLALNVNTDLEFFKLINPCGITDYPVASVSSIKERPENVDNVKSLLVDEFQKHFGYQLVDPTDLISNTVKNYFTL